MTDIHCHILPGIDDGASDMDESVEMARIAQADGIARIIATPHVKDDRPDPAKLREMVKGLNARIRAEGITVEVFYGADVSVLLLPEEMRPYAINPYGYILIEFPHMHLPRNARDMVFRMLVKGLRPIITHPERNSEIMRNPDLLMPILETGGIVQLTADSIVGNFGGEARQCARHFLKQGVVGVIASDAHSSQHRKPVLREAFHEAAEIVGHDEAVRMVCTRPEAIVRGVQIDA